MLFMHQHNCKNFAAVVFVLVFVLISILLVFTVSAHCKPHMKKNENIPITAFTIHSKPFQRSKYYQFKKIYINS